MFGCCCCCSFGCFLYCFHSFCVALFDILTLFSSWGPYDSLTVANLVPSWHKVFIIVIIIFTEDDTLTNLTIFSAQIFIFACFIIIQSKQTSNIILIFDIKENEWTYNRQLIYQQIYITNVLRPNISLRTFLKTKVKYLKSWKKLAVFLRSGDCRS